MSEPDNQPGASDEELADLTAKLDALDLSPAQRDLLTTILSIAWDVTRTDDSLDAQFAGSFKPGQAALILHYHQAPSTHLVSRSVTEHSALVSRLVSR